MKYRQMGRTGLMVSEICLGTMTFGSQLNEEGSIEVIDRALDSGINFIDAADLYVEGLSEQIVGKALKGKRSSVILASKIGAWKVGEENIGAVEVELTEEELRICDEVWHRLRPPRFSYGSQQVER